MLFWALSAGTTTYLSCIVDNVFATSESLKTDVALALIDVLKTYIRFKIKDLPAFNHSDRESIISLGWLTVEKRTIYRMCLFIFKCLNGL